MLAALGFHDRSSVVEVLPADAASGIYLHGTHHEEQCVLFQRTLLKNSGPHHTIKHVRPIMLTHTMIVIATLNEVYTRVALRGQVPSGCRCALFEGPRGDRHHQVHTVPHEAEEHDKMLKNTDPHGTSL